MTITATQTTQLLPELFRNVDEEQRINVLHIGPACSDTIEFFSHYRCRLQVFDLFAELPMPTQEETDLGLQHYFTELLQLPGNVQFDICLFWDIFSYLEEAALAAFVHALRPHLAPHCKGHGFSVHNPRTPPGNHLYGIADAHTLSLRTRPDALPGYRPHNQNRLRDALHCFVMERSVLLADRRLELLLGTQKG